MSESENSPRLTCGSIVLAALLAILVVVALYRQPEPPTWAATAAAAIAVVAVFIIERGVQNFLGGLAAAALLTGHPSWTAYPDRGGEILLAGSVILAAIAATRIGWHIAFHPRFAWRCWPLVFGAQSLFTGLAWTADPHLGIVSALLCCSGMATGALIGWRHRLRQPKLLPSRLNLLIAASLAVLVPPGGLLVYRFIDRSLRTVADWWDLIRGAFPETLVSANLAFQPPIADVWTWPHMGVVLPLLAVAFLLTVRRGWLEWTQRTIPVAWFLTQLTLVIASGLWLLPQETAPATALILTALTVLLLVFLVAYLLRATFDRLVLRPPDELEQDGIDRGGIDIDRKDPAQPVA
jgi:hypothetical protein